MKKKITMAIAVFIAVIVVCAGCACPHENTELRDTKKATCTENGYTGDIYCTDCGELVTEGASTEMLEHTAETVPGKDPKCTETGLTEGLICSVCGEILKAQETIDATGHTEKVLESVDPTCTETGLTEGSVCTVCGEILVPQLVLDAMGHSDETVPGKAPTCTEPGLTEGIVCSVCGEIIKTQESLEPTGHTEKKIAGKAATCTEDGLTEGIKCSVCGAVIKAQQTIKATGHQNTEVRDAKKATYTSGGYTGDTYCKDCGEKLQSGKKTAKKDPGDIINVRWLGSFLYDNDALSTSDFSDLISGYKGKILLAIDFGDSKSTEISIEYYDQNGKVVSTDAKADQEWTDGVGFTVNGVAFDTYTKVTTTVYSLSQCDKAIRNTFTTDYSLSSEGSGKIASCYDSWGGTYEFSVSGKDLIVVNTYHWGGAAGGGPSPFVAQGSCEMTGKNSAVAHMEIYDIDWDTGDSYISGTFDIFCDMDGDSYTVSSWSK